MLFDGEIDTSLVLAVLLLIAGVAGLGLATIVANPYAVALPTATLAAAVVFLVTRRETGLPTIESIPARSPLTLFFLALAGTILLYQAAGAQRSLAVHLGLVGCYCLAAVLLVTNAATWLSLGTILLTGVTQRAMAFYASPLYLGNDVFAHNRVVGELIRVGSLDPLSTSKYFYAPFYHLLVAVQSLVTGVSVRHAAFVSTTVLLVGVPALALYLVLARIWDDRTGGFGVLLYTASDFANHWAITPQVTSLGIVFFVLSMYLLVSYVDAESRRYHLSYLVAFLGVTLTHQVSTVITTLSVIILLAVVAFDAPAFRRRALWLGGVTVGITLLDFSVTRFGGPAGESPSFLFGVLSVWQSSLPEASFAGSSSVLPPDSGLTLSGSAALSIWHIAGTALLVGFAVVGTLHWIDSERIRTRTAIAFGAIVALLFPAVLLGPLFGLRFLIPWRWFAFLYVPFSILAAPGVAVLVSAVRDQLGSPPLTRSALASVAVILLLVGPYVFLMGGNAIAARDGPPLDESPGAERYAVTAPEAETLAHAAEYVPDNRPILGDFMVSHNVLQRHYRADNAETIQMESLDPTTIAANRPAILVNRSYMASGHVKFRYGTEMGIGDNPGFLVHGVIPVGEMPVADRDVVYSSGSTQLVVLPPSPTVGNQSTQ